MRTRKEEKKKQLKRETTFDGICSEPTLSHRPELACPSSAKRTPGIRFRGLAQMLSSYDHCQIYLGRYLPIRSLPARFPGSRARRPGLGTVPSFASQKNVSKRGRVARCGQHVPPGSLGSSQILEVHQKVSNIQSRHNKASDALMVRDRSSLIADQNTWHSFSSRKHPAFVSDQIQP